MENSPSLEEWKYLYRTTTEFKKLKPWRWMDDSDLFGVQDPQTGENGYCCVMGSGGEHFALALYLGSEGLDGLFKIQSGEIKPNDPQGLYVQKCLMVSFENREYIGEIDYEIIKDLGLRFRGINAWPLFRNYLPGYFPWYLDRDDVKFLNLAMEQIISVCKRIKNNPDALKPPLMTQMLIRINENKNWRDEWIEPWDIEEKVVTGSIESKIMKDLLKLSHHGFWEVDFNFISDVVQEDDNRPFFPCNILWADIETGIILDNTIVEPSKWSSAVLEIFSKITVKKSELPQEIYVKKREIYELMEPFTLKLDIEMYLTDNLEVIDEVQEYIDNNSPDDSILETLELMMEDEKFRELLESKKLLDIIQSGNITDIMEGNSMKELKDLICNENNRIAKDSKQTTLYPLDK